MKELIRRHPPKFYRCGICDQWHSAAWDGDCREGDARFNVEDIDAKYGEDGWEEVPMPGAEEGDVDVD